MTTKMLPSAAVAFVWLACSTLCAAVEEPAPAPAYWYGEADDGEDPEGEMTPMSSFDDGETTPIKVSASFGKDGYVYDPETSAGCAFNHTQERQNQKDPWVIGDGDCQTADGHSPRVAPLVAQCTTYAMDDDTVQGGKPLHGEFTSCAMPEELGCFTFANWQLDGCERRGLKGVMPYFAAVFGGQLDDKGRCTSPRAGSRAPTRAEALHELATSSNEVDQDDVYWRYDRKTGHVSFVAYDFPLFYVQTYADAALYGIGKSTKNPSVWTFAVTNDGAPDEFIPVPGCNPSRSTRCRARRSPVFMFRPKSMVQRAESIRGNDVAYLLLSAEQIVGREETRTVQCLGADVPYDSASASDKQFVSWSWMSVAVAAVLLVAL